MRQKQRIKSRHFKRIGLVILLPFTISVVSAQISVNTIGGNASGSGGTASYSVGQVVFNLIAGTNGSVAGGVQRPYEISVVTAIEEAKGINLTAYPNPTADYLTLEVKDFQLSALHFQLYDMNGKLLQNETITGSQTSIVMSSLVPAFYLVKVTQGNKEVKTFKIIKK